MAPPNPLDLNSLGPLLLRGLAPASLGILGRILEELLGRRDRALRPYRGYFRPLRATASLCVLALLGILVPWLRLASGSHPTDYPQTASGIMALSSVLFGAGLILWHENSGRIASALRVALNTRTNRGQLRQLLDTLRAARRRTIMYWIWYACAFLATAIEHLAYLGGSTGFQPTPH